MYWKRAGQLNKMKIANVIGQSCDGHAHFVWGISSEGHSHAETPNTPRRTNPGNAHHCIINRRFNCFIDSIGLIITQLWTHLRFILNTQHSSYEVNWKMTQTSVIITDWLSWCHYCQIKFLSIWMWICIKLCSIWKHMLDIID